MKVGIKTAVNYINRGIDKGIDKIESVVSNQYKHMKGDDIKGNGIVRQMKSAKKARKFYATTGTLGYALGSLEIVKGPAHTVFPGSPLFLTGIWQHCNLISTNNKVKTLNPDYKNIIKRAKEIYK